LDWLKGWPIGLRFFEHLTFWTIQRSALAASKVLQRNKNGSSTKQSVVMEFYGLPPIGQKQERPMDGAQFHPPRVGEAGGRLNRNTFSELFEQPNREFHKPGRLSAQRIATLGAAVCAKL
jgi:hypothetical protein